MSTDYSQFFYKAKSRLSTDALTPDNNELLVDLSRSRGEYKQQKLLAILDLIGTSGLSDEALPGYHYMLLGGHIGSGKSTELRVLQKQLTRHDRYFTVFIDIVEEIDFNNLSYSDLFITIGKRLVDEIGTANITLDQDFVTPLTSWAQEVVNTKNDSKILSSELKAGAKGKLGLPFVGALFSHFATSIRSNATYKSEVREVIVNNFTHLASALNQLLRHAEKQMQHENIARKILFIIDGTDRLTPEDAENFFSDGVMQLRQLKASFIYCTRNRFLDEDSRLAQLFSLVRIPMIKLNDKNGDIKDNHQDAWEAMREFVKRRVDERYFDNIETIDFLIHHSGGHLRDLIRLLENCVNNTFGETNIDMAIATESAKQIATIYQRDLEKNDIETLVEIDLNLDSPPPKTETTVRLLEKLLLLEYNSYWWRSHPLIQMLPVYQKAKQVHLTNHANP